MQLQSLGPNHCARCGQLRNKSGAVVFYDYVGNAGVICLDCLFRRKEKDGVQD